MPSRKQNREPVDVFCRACEFKLQIRNKSVRTYKGFVDDSRKVVSTGLTRHLHDREKDFCFNYYRDNNLILPCGAFDFRSSLTGLGNVPPVTPGSTEAELLIDRISDLTKHVRVAKIPKFRFLNGRRYKQTKAAERDAEREKLKRLSGYIFETITNYDTKGGSPSSNSVLLFGTTPSKTNLPPDKLKILSSGIDALSEFSTMLRSPEGRKRITAGTETPIAPDQLDHLADRADALVMMRTQRVRELQFGETEECGMTVLAHDMMYDALTHQIEEVIKPGLKRPAATATCANAKRAKTSHEVESETSFWWEENLDRRFFLQEENASDAITPLRQRCEESCRNEDDKHARVSSSSGSSNDEQREADTL